MERTVGRLVVSAFTIGITSAVLLSGCSAELPSTSSLAASGKALGAAALRAGTDGSTQSSSTPTSTPMPTPTSAHAAGAPAATSPKGTSPAPSSGSGSTAPAGWSSTMTCPSYMLTDTEAIVGSYMTVTQDDPSQVSGLAPDPALTKGDVPTCAFTLATSTTSGAEYIFWGMPESYFTSFGTKLIADGFTASAQNSTSTGNSQSFGKSGGLITDAYFAPSTNAPAGYVILTG